MDNFLNNICLENTVQTDSEFKLTTRNSRLVTADELRIAEFKLKDTIDVPIGEKNYVFVVEHIRPLDDGSKKVYFVAKNIFVRNKMNLEEINGLLDGIESAMPREFVEQLADFEHLTSKGFEMTRRVNLLSLGNFKDTEGYCIGKDDIVFDGLRTEMERVKNYGKVSEWYWTCTPWKGEQFLGIPGSEAFYSVRNSGSLSVYDASNIFGVVPSFSILCFTLENKMTV